MRGDDKVNETTEKMMETRKRQRVCVWRERLVKLAYNYHVQAAMN